MKMVRICLVLVIMMSMLSNMIIDASAYELFGGKFVLTNGLSLSYKIDYDTILKDNIRKAIREAFVDWEWHLNSAVEGINMHAYFTHNIYQNSVADITIRALDEVYSFGVACHAKTDLFKADGTRVFLNEVYDYDWVRAEIIISTTEFDKMTYDQMKATIIHEIGHALGLAHNPDNGTIMYETLKNCTAYVPTLDDIQGVYAIYGDQL